MKQKELAKSNGLVSCVTYQPALSRQHSIFVSVVKVVSP